MLAFNRVLAEVNDIAGQRETVAEKLTSTVISTLQSSIHDIKQERKKVWHHGFFEFCLCWSFYLLDTMLARVLAMPCVCLSVTSRSSVNMAERIELVFGMWAPFYPSFTVLKRNSGISKNKGTSLRHFILNSGLGNFCFGVSVVETCYQ